MTQQPKWKQVGVIGDIDFIDYGGGIVFEDETGVYPPELEWVEPLTEDEGPANVYRIVLDDLTLSPSGNVIPAMYGPSWPHPIEEYTEWFDRELERVASFVGLEYSELIKNLTSGDAISRAWSFQAMAEFHGWENFDDYPLTLSYAELEERYKKHPYLNQASE